MPIIKSAKKRVRVTRKASVENSKTKRAMREAVKAFQAKVAAKKDTTKEQAEAFSVIDTAHKKGVISKNKAARKKSQINKISKEAGTTKPGTKKVANKVTATKSTVKKAPAKKAPVNKTSVKKPVTKKSTKK